MKLTHHEQLMRVFQMLPADIRETLHECYRENVHRIGAINTDGDPYTLAAFLADIVEDSEPIAWGAAFRDTANTYRENMLQNNEICTGCPTHCTDLDDDDPIAPTYHGITRIRCNGCGYETRRRSAMEIWNDIAGTCPQCDADPLDITYDRADGTSVRVHGPADDPELTDVTA